jgi:cell division protease FtsH
MNRIFRNTIFYLLIFLVIIGVVSFFNGSNEPTDHISYDKFVSNLEKGQVKSFSMQPDRGVYEVRGQSTNGKSFLTYIPSSEKIQDRIDKAAATAKVDVMPAKETSGWVTFFTSIIPFVIIFILFFFLLNQAQGGGSRVMNFGKSKARLYNDDKKKVRFRDVAGADEEKQELIEVVDFLKDPRKFAELGARIPKGVLLVGPPGTGKTLLARAVAGEAGVPFFSISGSDFVEMFVGVGASRVRDLFENAKKNAPCIIFIDEIDAVGRHRGSGMGGGNDEREQTLNQLLAEMDGFETSPTPVIVIAATNRKDVLDKALLRPGRFDRIVTVPYPDLKSREAILGVHVKNVLAAEDLDVKKIAQGTPGFSGADLANLVNEATIIASKENKDMVNMHDFDAARDKIMLGKESKSIMLTNEDKKLIAYHEAGHALVRLLLPETSDPLHKVTIIPRGSALGVTHFLPEREKYITSKEEMEASVMSALGGRVAEEITFNKLTTGAYSDFQTANRIVRNMVCHYGMSLELGTVIYGQQHGDFEYSQKTAEKIDAEVQRLTKLYHEQTRTLLENNRDKLDTLANALIEKETMHADEIYALLGIEPRQAHKLVN